MQLKCNRYKLFVFNCGRSCFLTSVEVDCVGVNVAHAVVVVVVGVFVVWGHFLWFSFSSLSQISVFSFFFCFISVYP